MPVDLNFPRVCEPSARLKRIVEAAQYGAASDDPMEDAILRALREDVDVPDEVIRSLQIYSNTRWRNIFEALMLVGCEPNDIHNLTGVSILTIEIFEKYLFDVSVFEDYPDRYDYVHENACEEDGYEFKFIAIDMGVEYLRAAVRPDRCQVPRGHALTRALTTAYMRMCADGQSDMPRRAEEARKWAEVMVRTLQVGANMDSDTGPSIDKLVIALQARSAPIHDIEDAQILH